MSTSVWNTITSLFGNAWMSSTGDKTSLAVVNTFEGIATVKILVQEQVCKKNLKKERGKFKKGQSLEKCLTDVKKKKAWKSWKEF